MQPVALPFGSRRKPFEPDNGHLEPPLPFLSGREGSVINLVIEKVRLH